MAFTFECGVCHAVYRLDESQISGAGVKITCPKCLNYFFLRPDSPDSDIQETPIVEHVIPDGAQEVGFSPSSVSKTEPLISDQDVDIGEALDLPDESSREELQIDLDEPVSVEDVAADEETDAPSESEPPPRNIIERMDRHVISASLVDVPLDKAPGTAKEGGAGERPSLSEETLQENQDTVTSAGPPYEDRVGPTDRGYPERSDTQVTMAELSDYPPDKVPETKVDRYLLPVSLGIIVVGLVIFLNYRRILPIPGLESLQMAEEVEEVAPPEEELNSEPTPLPKHGFPAVDPGYDPWAEGK